MNNIRHKTNEHIYSSAFGIVVLNAIVCLHFAESVFKLQLDIDYYFLRIILFSRSRILRTVAESTFEMEIPYLKAAEATPGCPNVNIN